MGLQRVENKAFQSSTRKQYLTPTQTEHRVNNVCTNADAAESRMEKPKLCQDKNLRRCLN
jgi:hypothetical protein